MSELGGHLFDDRKHVKVVIRTNYFHYIFAILTNASIIPAGGSSLKTGGLCEVGNLCYFRRGVLTVLFI